MRFTHERGIVTELSALLFDDKLSATTTCLAVLDSKYPADEQLANPPFSWSSRFAHEPQPQESTH